MSTPNSQPPLISAIYAATQDMRVRLAEIFGASFEGGIYGPWGTAPGGKAVGDQGTSFGPFQIHMLPGRNVTPQQAVDPASAVAFMTPQYAAAVRAVPDSLWQTDPALAAETAAYHAERPAKSYLDSYGRAAVDAHYQTAAGILGGKIATGGGAGAFSTSGASGVYQQGGNVQNVGLLGSVGSAFFDTLTGPFAHMFGASSFQDLAERGALIMFGGLLVLVGLIMLVKDTSAGQAAGNAAKDAAMVAVAA